jgi:hypothetical protein
MIDWFSLIGFQHINVHPWRFIVLKDKISPDCKGFVRRKINICYNAYKRKKGGKISPAAKSRYCYSISNIFSGPPGKYKF